MSTTRRLCPVCYRPVEPTKLRKVAGHMDKNYTPCPGSFINYTHTLTDGGPPCASTNANDVPPGGPPTPGQPTAPPEDSVPPAFPPSAINSVSTRPADH